MEVKTLDEMALAWKSGMRSSQVLKVMLVSGVLLLLTIISTAVYTDLQSETQLMIEKPSFSGHQVPLETVTTERQEDMRTRKLRIARRREKREQMKQEFLAQQRKVVEDEAKGDVLMDKDGVEPFEHLNGMKHIPDDAPFKKELMSDSFLLRDENILYRSPAAIKYAEERKAAGDKNLYMTKGVIWGAVGSSVAGNQNADLKTGLDVFQRYITEISYSAQSARMFLRDDDKNPVGFALVIDYALEDLLPEQIEMFDYIIYNRIPREAAEYFPDGIGWCGKVSILLFTPFEQTLYVDGDTRFCSDVRPEFESLSSASIALAHEHRGTAAQQGSMRFNFNAGVIVYRKSAVVATLMHDVIQSIMLQWKGDQPEWANRLMEFNRYGNVRVNILSPRFHMQPCRETKDRCVVSGDIILLHGRCWFPNTRNLEQGAKATAKFCGHLNAYTGSRFVTTMCSGAGKNLGIYKLGVSKLDATLTEVEPPK